MNVFTASEMRACDRRTIEEYGVPGVCLMEAAGIALVNACREERSGSVNGAVITVLCGKGNNGGDGFVAARHLLSQGATVHLFLLGGTVDDLQGDAKAHFAPLARLLAEQKLSLTLIPDVSNGEADLTALTTALQKSVLVLDCIYGTGFRPPLPPLIVAVAQSVRDSGVRTIACDIPSGINADTGDDGGVGAIAAHRTVTFAGYKRGVLFYPGATYSGAVTVAPIGIPASVLDETASATLTTRDWVRQKLPRRQQSRDANKGRFGTVLVIAGSAGMAGAATLTALSALRTGAGLVHLAVPESLLDTAAVLAPELVLHALPETPERSHGGKGSLEKLLALAEIANSIIIGPGMGGNTVTKSHVQTFVQKLTTKTPLVIDADGLNAIAEVGGDILEHRTGNNTILTPHPGEAGRLLGKQTRIIQEDRAGSVQELAQRYHATVLLKGVRTIIATDSAPDRLYINHSGSVALATAGSGDVLTGVMGALLADRENHLSAQEATRIGAFLHAVAGEICATRRGEVGTIATEIRDTLPEARKVLYDDSYWTGSLNKE